MIKPFLLWWKCARKRGFILLELVLSLLITVLLAVMLFRGLQLLLPSWTKVSQQTSLYNTGHYILSILDKNMGYDGLSINISKDSKGMPKIICQTNNGNQSFSFTCENKRISKTITKGSSSGTNPLYTSNCLVEEWSLTKLSENKLLVELKLRQEKESCKLSRIITCMNGSITYES